jgi:hypothetical protein
MVEMHHRAEGELCVVIDMVVLVRKNGEDVEGVVGHAFLSSGIGLARVALVDADKIREASGGHGEVRGELIDCGVVPLNAVQRFLDDIARSASCVDQQVPSRTGIRLGARLATQPTPDALAVLLHDANEDGGSIPRGRHEDGRGITIGIDEGEHGRHVEVGEVTVRSRVRGTDRDSRWAHDLAREGTGEILGTLIALRTAVPIGEDERVEFDAVALLDLRKREFGVRTADVAHEVPTLIGANANPHAPHLCLALASRVAVHILAVQDGAAVRGRSGEVFGLGLNGVVRHGVGHVLSFLRCQCRRAGCGTQAKTRARQASRCTHSTRRGKRTVRGSRAASHRLRDAEERGRR